MSNLNKTYHKGYFRNGEWGKHLRPYSKRVGNKRFRQTGKGIFDDEDPFAANTQRGNKKKPKKRIRARIYYQWKEGYTTTQTKNFASMRDVQNASNRHNVIKVEIFKR